MFNRATSVRLTNTMFVTQSFQTASQIAIFTLLTVVAADLSQSESLAGLPATMATLVQSLMALPMGILMGRMGRRFGLTVSYSVGLMGALLGIFAILQGQFWLLLLSSACIGAGRSGADQSRFAAGDLFPDGERARMIGRVVFAGTIGAIFGPLLVGPGGQLAESFGLDVNIGPWLIATGFFIAATLITATLLRPEPMKIARELAGEEKKKKNDVPETTRSILEMLRIPGVQLAVLSMLISQAVMVTLMVITPLHMAHHDYGTGDISLVISAHTLGMFGLSALTGRLIDRFGAIHMMMMGALTLIVSAIVSPLSTDMFFLLTGLFLLGLGWNFGYIAGSSLLSDVLRGEERSRMQGANDMLVAGAAALGSFSSGPLFSVGGYVAVAGVGLVVTILFLWIIRLLAQAAPAPQQA